METRDGAVTGAPNLILRGEGLGVLALSLWGYSQVDMGWGLFAQLILIPDLSMLGYLAGPRVGAAAYNAAHTYLAAIALLSLGHVGAIPSLTALGLIWAAHIGADRLMGYGLKYPTTFKATHLSIASRVVTADVPASQ